MNLTPSKKEHAKISSVLTALGTDGEYSTGLQDARISAFLEEVAIGFVDKMKDSTDGFIDTVVRQLLRVLVNVRAAVSSELQRELNARSLKVALGDDPQTSTVPSAALAAMDMPNVMTLGLLEQLFSPHNASFILNSQPPCIDVPSLSGQINTKSTGRNWQRIEATGPQGLRLCSPALAAALGRNKTRFSDDEIRGMLDTSQTELTTDHYVDGEGDIVYRPLCLLSEAAKIVVDDTWRSAKKQLRHAEGVAIDARQDMVQCMCHLTLP